MCVAVPGRVISLEGESAVVEVNGTRRKVSLLALPEVQVGQYVLVSLGMAVEILSEEEARSLRDLWRDLIAAQDLCEERGKP